MSSYKPIMVEIAPGELIDKLTILEIKVDRITDPAKQANVQRELAVLRESREQITTDEDELNLLTECLREVNSLLWEVEDELRDCESRGDFGPRFIELARSVYRTNDERARMKRRINDYCGSVLVEEKSYNRYD